MPRDITMKPFRIVTAVCAFSLSMAQVKAEDTLNRAGRWGVGSVQLAVFGEEDVRAGKPVTDEVRLHQVVTQLQDTDDMSGAPGK
jgi:hypothetical protein